MTPQYGWPTLNGLLQDCRVAIRVLRATPLVTLAAILSLALGIGGNTAIFSILNSLLLKPLPVREPSQLVALDVSPSDGTFGVGYPVWSAIRDSGLLNQPFAWAPDVVQLSQTGESTSANAVWASGNIFAVLGLHAAVGQAFDLRDDVRGGGARGPVAVLSDDYWRRDFDRRPDIVGATLLIERVPFTIVGVMPPGFYGLNVGTSFDVLLPLEAERQLGRTPERLESATWDWLFVMARLRPGESSEALTAELRRLQPNIRASVMPSFDYPQDREAFLAKPWVAASAPGGVSRLRRQYVPALSTLLLLSGLVLVVACVNVATLLMARTAARSHEFGVRRALGASTARLLRQLLVESGILAGAGMAVGLAMAWWGSRLLVSELSTWAYVATLDLAPDWRVFSATAALTAITAVLFGMAPAARAAATRPISALKDDSHGATSSRRARGASLIVVQVAVSAVMIVGSLLLLRSFVALARRDLGFDRNHVLVAVVDLRNSAAVSEARLDLYERLRQAVARVPGVSNVALSLATPLGSAGVRLTPQFSRPGQAPDGQRWLTTPVSQGWFETFGTRLLAGRDFNEQDTANAPGVAIVNEAFARRFFGESDPVGQVLIETDRPTQRAAIQVVGLIEDAAFTSVRDPMAPVAYRPLVQQINARLASAVTTVSVSVRVASPASEAQRRQIGAAIGSVDPNIAFTFRTLRETLDPYYIRERLLASVALGFGVLALLMAGLGIYGVTAYSMYQRRTEIGIRMALGATPSGVANLLFPRMAALVAIGVVCGLVASSWASRFLAFLLYDVQPHDPIAFLTAAAAVMAVAVASAALPVWRASHTEPAVVLREG